MEKAEISSEKFPILVRQSLTNDHPVLWLRNIFNFTGKFSENRARVIFKQICSAVNYMHGRGMIHRDLKAENIFFTWKDHVLLGDFGFATRLEKADQHLTTFCGSPPYAAPELYVVT